VYLSKDAEDATLVSQCLAGDASAFERLVCRYQRPLFTVAYRMLGNYDEASDATQDAFVRAYEKLTTFDPRYRFFSWIYRILVNECHNVRRARRVEEPVTPDLMVGGDLIETLELAERRRHVQAAILALPPEYREVIVLRHFGELSYEEMSAALRIPEKTVKSRLYIARQRLAYLLRMESVYV
jgi:RNA polymerase sigma-70 factor (ECF subfamily)